MSEENDPNDDPSLPVKMTGLKFGFKIIKIYPDWIIEDKM